MVVLRNAQGIPARDGARAAGLPALPVPVQPGLRFRDKAKPAFAERDQQVGVSRISPILFKLIFRGLSIDVLGWHIRKHYFGRGGSWRINPVSVSVINFC